MIHSKNEKIQFFVFLLIFLLFQIAVSDESIEEKRQAGKLVPLSSNSNVRKLNESLSSAIKNDQKEQKNVSTSKTLTNITSYSTATTITAPSTNTTVQVPTRIQIPSVNYGALTRGIFVILGLSVVVIAYMMFRSLRVNKPHTQMVRKYGILAHKQDVEMRPLPLDEDDEDDTTVFDASNFSPQRSIS